MFGVGIFPNKALEAQEFRHKKAGFPMVAGF
jgi:hypothetical protein